VPVPVLMVLAVSTKRRCMVSDGAMVIRRSY
jgi:hypothetical protein